MSAHILFIKFIVIYKIQIITIYHQSIFIMTMAGGEECRQVKGECLISSL